MRVSKPLPYAPIIKPHSSYIHRRLNFFVQVDCSMVGGGGQLPSLAFTRQAVSMLMLRYPSRLGKLFLVNAGLTVHYLWQAISLLLSTVRGQGQGRGAHSRFACRYAYHAPLNTLPSGDGVFIYLFCAHGQPLVIFTFCYHCCNGGAQEVCPFLSNRGAIVA